jgi:Uma2 family endonuclease
METSSKLFTYGDYLALPEDGKRYEVIEGHLSMTPVRKPRHQEIQLRLAAILLAHAEKQNLGKVYVAPVDVGLSLVDIVQPDILFVTRDRLSIVTTRNIAGTPDLIVEILSAASSQRDQVEKLLLYQRFSLLEYWIVDPEKERVDVYLLGEGKLNKSQTRAAGGQLATKQFPGLIIDVAAIFR